MKKVVRLTEGDLHRIVKNSVRRIINEMENEGFRDSFMGQYRNPVGRPEHVAGEHYINGDYGEDNDSKWERTKTVLGSRLGNAAGQLKRGKFVNPFKGWKEY